MCFLLLPAWTTTQATGAAERERLAAYGVAHCLHKHASGATQSEAGPATGDFFQLSPYENEQALAAVRYKHCPKHSGGIHLPHLYAVRIEGMPWH